MGNLVNVKLTEKEEKVVATIIAFFRGLKECKKEEEFDYILQNAFASRMILSFGKAEPKDAHTILASYIIQNIIPYLVADKEDSIDEISEEFDKKTDEMMKDVINHKNEIINYL
jgi:hypothetical protein